MEQVILKYTSIIHLLYRTPVKNNETFSSKLQSFLYNVALAITGAIRETSQTQLHAKLGLESL